LFFNKTSYGPHLWANRAPLRKAEGERMMDEKDSVSSIILYDMAEAHRNRTYQPASSGLSGFEDRAAHQNRCASTERLPDDSRLYNQV
jgi:hypothetical protein